MVESTEELTRPISGTQVTYCRAEGRERGVREAAGSTEELTRPISGTQVTCTGEQGWRVTGREGRVISGTQVTCTGE